MINPILIDDTKLIQWIENDKVVPGPASPGDVNQFYIIVPPLQTFVNTSTAPEIPPATACRGFIVRRTSP
jgi:hypothetical protein